jgi:hypothetical protein
MFAFSIADFMACAPNCGADKVANAPLKEPIGVRAVETM